MGRTSQEIADARQTGVAGSEEFRKAQEIANQRRGFHSRAASRCGVS